MPLIKSVVLQNIIICPELVDFCVGHSHTLESISFLECFGCVSETDRPYHWHELFNALLNAKPRRLRQFEVMPFDIPLENEFWLEETPEKIRKTRELLGKIRELLGTEPNPRLFAYKWLDRKYGAVRRDDDENRRAFLKGQDHASYLKLMDLINTNATEHRGSARTIP
ncbi:MAG: hypothetical protein M1833_006015 [Piccolia ochrophora]|nr:MAG: hypothetical protein M1833_006015 [Piccolia ochrophora]